jgi:hypothetical protein
MIGSDNEDDNVIMTGVKKKDNKMKVGSKGSHKVFSLEVLFIESKF